MSEANFALVLNAEARAAAEDFEKKLGIPSIELTRFYDIEKIRRQYRALGAVLGTTFEDTPYYEEALHSIEQLKHLGQSLKERSWEGQPERPDESLRDRPGAGLRKNPGGIIFSVGECLNADAFELALALAGYGFHVKEIFGTLTTENFKYLSRLAKISPQTKVYSNLHPTMIYYEPDEEERSGIHVALGKDAGFYHRKAKCVPWNSDIQPYGYDGVRRLMEEILKAVGEDGEIAGACEGNRESL